jgi:glycosyltransferase involved in cell wall biosynthesis|tara:strand:+ start:539 stop:1249 length:711 start_codon:yes stop_codon:yes gene_type:complete
VNKLASIITSVYNSSDQIEGLLKDVRRQTFFDLCEWIFVDAASPQNEFDLIKPFADEHENVILHKLDQDKGVYDTWNYAIKNSSAPYISNWNCDDRRAPWALERQIKTLDENPSVGLVYNIILETPRPNETFEFNTSKSVWPCLDFSKENLYRVNSPHNSPMWRRSLHDDFGYFNTEYKSASDYDMWVRAVLGGAKFLKINEPLSLYYRSPDGVSTNSVDLEKNVADFKEIREKLK